MEKKNEITGTAIIEPMVPYRNENASMQEVVSSNIDYETPVETIALTAPSTTTVDSDPIRRTVKQRKSDLDEYHRRYMPTPRIEDRKPVFVSRTTRDRLDRIVRLFGERGMSVSGMVENIARQHLDTYEPEVEHWRKM